MRQWWDDLHSEKMMAAASTSVRDLIRYQYTLFYVACIWSILFLPGTLVFTVYQGHVKLGTFSLLSFFEICLFRRQFAWCAGWFILGSS